MRRSKREPTISKNSRARRPRVPLKPDGGESPWIPVARIEGIFGIRGELKCRPSSAGETLLAPGTEFATDESGRGRVICTHVRLHKGRPLVRFEGVDDADGAQAFVGRSLFARAGEVVLGDDEFLDDDLVGFRLLDPGGAELGAVSGVEHYPAADYLVVGPQRALVPMVRDFIRAIDREARTISVSLPPGLLDPSLAEEA